MVIFRCISDMFPFSKLNNQNFNSYALNSHKKNVKAGSSINLKSPPNLISLINQPNNSSSDLINKNSENMIDYKYMILTTYSIMMTTLSLFHYNTCPLNKNFHDIEYLIKSTDLTFDVISSGKWTNLAQSIKNVFFIKNI